MALPDHVADAWAEVLLDIAAKDTAAKLPSKPVEPTKSRQKRKRQKAVSK